MFLIDYKAKINNILNSPRLGTILLIISSLFSLLLILILLSTPNQDGYEISLYDGYPVFFWWLLIASFALAIGSLILFYTHYEKKWILSFYVVLQNNTLLMLIPYIRGYYFFGEADAIWHIGTIREIIANGGFNLTESRLFYPILHLTGADFFIITNFPKEVLPYAIIIPYALLYSLAFFLLARTLTKDRMGRALVIVLGTIPIFGWNLLNLSPFVLSLYLLPFIFYIFIIRNSLTMGPMNKSLIRYTFLIILLLILLPLVHPLTTILFVIIILSFLISQIVQRVLKRGINTINYYDKLINNSKGALAIILLVFTAWICQFYIINDAIGAITQSLMGGGRGAPIESIQYLASKAKMADLISTFIIRFGAQALFIGLAGIFVLKRIHGMIFEKKEIEMLQFSFYLLYIIFIFITAAFLFGNFLAMEFELRPMQILTIISMLIVGLSIPHFLNRNIIRIATVALIILFVVVVAIFTAFSSPIVRSTNWQVTEEQISNIEWLSNHEQSSIVYYVGEVSRFNWFVGSETMIFSHQLPAHLDFKNLTPDNINDLIIVIDQKTMITYQTLYPDYPESWKYSPEDFLKVNYDSEYSRVYINSNSAIWSYSET